MKKVVIFYSKTAGGHLITAEAIAEGLRQNNDKLAIVMLDALEQTSFGFRINPATSFGILSIPLLPLYNLLYLLTNNFIGFKVLRSMIKILWGRQFKRLIEDEDPDLIVTTHPFISPSTIHTLKKKYPFVTVVTDLGNAHRIWFDKKTDKIITPTPKLTLLAKLLLKPGNNQVIHLGYPLKTHFQPNLNKKFSNTILIMGGGTGSGRIAEQLKILQTALPHKRLIVVCGFNKSLYNQLVKIKNATTLIYQFVNNIFELMSSSDIIITKAGPGTIIEAAQIRKPMIITDWIGIQEKENVKFVVDNNLGIFCPNLDKLAECIEIIYQDYSKYANHKNNWSGLQNITNFLNGYPADVSL